MEILAEEKEMLMSEFILSAGIDIGTSTTQLVFSRLLINNVNGFGVVPKIEIVSKEVFYRSNIYFTPLTLDDEIDLEQVKQLIRMEYEKAGINRSDLATGAIIITGESSRKRNAREVIEALSDIAGDFVVATAGPELESVLAGKGSGAATISEQEDKLVANLDIGGGTTNICYFRNGKVVDTACLDIGGRLIKIEDGKISYISKKMNQFLDKINISIKIGDPVDENNNFCMAKFETITKYMVWILEQSVSLIPTSDLLDFMKTSRLITCKEIPEVITFSGGVADCIQQTTENKFAYGDIGILLGEAIRNSALLQEKALKKASETMNATVIGAGNYSMDVSGSTIEYQNFDFPLKNIPVVYVEMDEKNLSRLHITIENNIREYKDAQIQFALSSGGLKCPSFKQIEVMAEEIVRGYNIESGQGIIPILVLEADIAKALGQAIKRVLPRKSPFLCIDHIACSEGDYIDIGIPVASGKVIPVIVKTLIFNT